MPRAVPSATRSPLLALAVLVGAFAVPAVVWWLRTPPYEVVDCGAAGPPDVRRAWVAGIEPIAFGLGCAVAFVACWAAASRGALNGVRLLVAGAALGLGGWWWAVGERSPAATLAAADALLLLPGLVVTAVLAVIAVQSSLRHREDGWVATERLAWWSLWFGVPNVVLYVTLYKTDVYC